MHINAVHSFLGLNQFSRASERASRPMAGQLTSDARDRRPISGQLTSGEYINGVSHVAPAIRRRLSWCAEPTSLCSINKIRCASESIDIFKLVSNQLFQITPCRKTSKSIRRSFTRRHPLRSHPGLARLVTRIDRLQAHRTAVIAVAAVA